mgnify:CR=1 FL=1
MTVIAELHQDHKNLSKLLDVLREKVKQLRQGAQPSYHLIADVVDYIGFYADSHHHPREDKMYAYFKHRDVELDEVMARCELEHRALRDYSSDLIEAIDGVLNDAVMPMDAFITRLEEYVEHQVKHLNLEEGEIFPRIEKIATAEDWEVLAQRLPRIDDPLFGEKQAEQYIDLYRELMLDLAS